MDKLSIIVTYYECHGVALQNAKPHCNSPTCLGITKFCSGWIAESFVTTSSSTESMHNWAGEKQNKTENILIWGQFQTQTTSARTMTSGVLSTG